MKNLDELILSFPVMDEKKQQSTLGGDTYDEHGGGGGGIVDGGQYGNGVTIYGGSTYMPYYPTPGITNPNNPNDPNYNPITTGDGSIPIAEHSVSGDITPHPLHPDMINDLTQRLKYDLQDPREKVIFQRTLAELGSSVTGDKILAKIDKYLQEHPNGKGFTISDTLGQDNMIEFDPATGILHLGPTSFDNQHFDSYNMYLTGHELYHAFEYSNGQNPLLSNYELDAYLFGSEVVKEANVDSATSNYAKGQEVTTLNEDEMDSNQLNFKSAWENFLNGDYSQSNYANLALYFFPGSANGSQYEYTKSGIRKGNDQTAVPQFIQDLAQQH